MITALGILGGAVLGIRYKVLCLVPTAATGIAAVAALDFINEVPVRSTVQSGLALVIGLQIGYLVSAIVRSALFAGPAGSITEPGPLHEQTVRNFLLS